MAEQLRPRIDRKEERPRECHCEHSNKMTDYNDKARAVILAALMVFSVFAGTVAFTGTAAAQSATAGNSSLTPNSVQEGSTNDLTVDLQLDSINTNDSTNQKVVLDFNDSLDLSSSGVSNVDVSGQNVTYSGDSNVDSTNNVVNVTFGDASGSGVNSDTVNVSFDVQTVTAPAVQGDQSTDVGLAIDSNDDGTADSSVSNSFFTLQITDTTTSGSSANRAGPGGIGDFDTQDGDGVVYDGATVFQGESSIELAGNISGGVV
ncbi:surface glycoprotein, partial [Haloplanus sp. C73]|uniref:surface glycoprotein n=1 Tax=Haloplanus sp. C73 TaxID=3421641 RepID=UPI003EB89BCB